MDVLHRQHTVVSANSFAINHTKPCINCGMLSTWGSTDHEIHMAINGIGGEFHITVLPKVT